MHAEFSYAYFEWSFFAIYCYFQNQNISSVEQGACKKVALFINGATLRRFIVHVHTVFVPVFQCHAGLLTKKCNLFSCT